MGGEGPDRGCEATKEGRFKKKGDERTKISAKASDK